MSSEQNLLIFSYSVLIPVIHRDVLTIRGVNDELVVCVCTSMPDAIKSTLTEKLTASFLEDPLKTVDTGASSHETDEMVCFEAIHFSWYNRSSTKVRILLQH